MRPSRWWLSSQPTRLRAYVCAVIALAAAATITTLTTTGIGPFDPVGVAVFCGLAVAVSLMTPSLLWALPGRRSFEDATGVWIIAALVLWGPLAAMVVAVLVAGVWTQLHDRVRLGIGRETAKQVFNVAALVLAIDAAALELAVVEPTPPLLGGVLALLLYVLISQACVAGVLLAAGHPNIRGVFTSMSHRVTLFTEIPLGLGLAMAWRASPAIGCIVASALVAAGAGAHATLLLEEASTDRRTGVLRPDPWLSAATRLVGSQRVGFLLVDVDHFKSVNDVHGHLVGDQVLASVAQILRDCLRPGDVAGRWGGEEFVVAIPGVVNAEMLAVAARIAEAVRLAPDLSVDGLRVARTVSIGCVLAERTAREHAAEAVRQAVARADAAMYAAKEAGRDQVFAQREPIRAS